MNAEQFFNNGFGADVEKVHRKHVIELMTNFAKHYYTEQCNIANVGGSIPSQAELVAETADAYCPNCEAYIVNERVTYDECCDNCGTEIEWHE